MQNILAQAVATAYGMPREFLSVQIFDLAAENFPQRKLLQWFEFLYTIKVRKCSAVTYLET